MNSRIAAILLLPIGAAALLPRSASASEATFPSSNPNYTSSSMVIAQRYDDWQRYRNDNHSDWDRNHRREEVRRVWIPGHWERGFLGIGRKWVEGHWEYRRS